MHTGRTVTVFRKLEEPPPGPDPPENLEQTPPRKFGADTPPKKFGADTPWKFGADTPPKIWSRHPSPENLEQTPPREQNDRQV